MFSDAHGWSKKSPRSRFFFRFGLAQRVVEAADHVRIALELSNDRACVDVVDSRHAHPLADDAEVHAMILLARIGRVAGAVEVKDHVMVTRPLRHRLDSRVADDQVDHDDDGTKRMRELGSLVHLLHRARGDIEVVSLYLARGRRRAVHRLHAVQVAVAPVHERLRVDVLVVLHEVEAAFQRLVDDAPVVASGKTELGLRRGAEEGAAELVEAFALDDDSSGGTLERL